MLPPFLTMVVVHPRDEGCSDEEVKWPDIPALFVSCVGEKG
jgi:hypothetical protein